MILFMLFVLPIYQIIMPSVSEPRNLMLYTKSSNPPQFRHTSSLKQTRRDRRRIDVGL